MTGGERKKEDDTGIRPPSFVLQRFYFAATFALDNRYIPVHDCSMFVRQQPLRTVCRQAISTDSAYKAMMLHLRESKHDI
jgi:hypothetical protein